MTLKRMGKSSIVSNSQPRSVAVGDFNNDDRIDIVVANSGTHTIGIFILYDNGTFSDQKTYSTGSRSSPYTVIVNDFNNDNYLDIAVANYGTNNIGIFLGYGNGTFSSQNVFSTGSSRPLFITTGDFNHDNRSDIVVANYGTNSIGIFLGHGNGSFQVEKTFFTAYDSLPYSLAVKDFNNDSHLDIAIANYGTHNIGILLGYGNESFESQKTYTTGPHSNPSSIAIGDFNNDNHLDIVVANSGTGNLGVLLGFGNGTFIAQQTYFINTNSYPQYIAVGDFNKDKQLDVAIVDPENDQIHIILGSDNGTFTTLTTYEGISKSRPFSIAIADFNKDNQSDIVVANYGSNEVLVMSGYFSEPSAKQTNYLIQRHTTTTSLVIADFNNDNYLDIVTNGFSSDDLVLLAGYRNETFVREKTFSTGYQSFAQQFCTSDLNNDNRMDIVSANMGSDNVGIILADTNQIFANVTIYSTGIGSSPLWVAVGDVNNDKKLDIISANAGTNSVGVLLGRGDGTFAIAVTYSTGVGTYPRSVAVGYVNNDDYLDIVTANLYSSSVSILHGDGNGTFKMVMMLSTGYNSNPTAITLADFNSDNYLDIAITTFGAGNIGIFLGYGDGNFEAGTSYSTKIGSISYSLIVADFNHDNQLDIATPVFRTDEVVIYFGYGNGSFRLARTYSTGFGSHPYNIAVADFNNDTQLEIVVGLYGSGTVAILTQYLAAKFTNEAIYSTDSTPQPYSIAIGDLNNDNRSDIVIADSGTDNLHIGFDFDNDTFRFDMIYPTGIDSHPQYVLTGDINNDNHLDIIITNSKHNSISMIIGHGNGTFADQMLYSTGDGSYPSAVIVGDFNNDNRSDLVIVNEGTDTIATLVGYDYAVFENQPIYRSANNLTPTTVVTTDFNNDNYLDIGATFVNSGNVGILLGCGNASFGAMMTYPTGIGSFPTGLAVNDFNSDGRIDIAAADYGTDNVIVLIGYGNGSFASMMYFSTGDNSRPFSVAIADLNRDGCLDIAVANSGSDTVGILIGYGNGNFATIMTYSTGDGSYPVAIIISDLNKDNCLDIVVVNQNTGNIGILLGYGNGSLASQVTYSIGRYGSPWSAVVSDLNNDGTLDIATANYNLNSIGLFTGYGNGTFRKMVAYSTGTGSLPRYVTVGDMNNDNRLDIIMVNYGTNDVIIYFGYKNGVYYEGKPYSIGNEAGPISLAIGDFNNDGRSDFVVANLMADEIGVFLGYGSELFGSLVTYDVGSGSQPRTAAIGDFNSDGKSDIVVANYGTNNVAILLGDGYTNFYYIVDYSTGVGSAPCSVAVGNFNNDNHSDIVVANCESNNLSIFLGFGNGSFAIGATYSTGDRSRPSSVAIADFNKDNRMDIVVANFGTNNVFLLYGYGNGSFGNNELHPLGYDYRPYAIAINDLNQDGWLDIVVGCYGTDNVEILMKMC
ncbi:unnamed protein product [Rotaria sp. Silwood2]|nr:unnamed protein product [Rotaria sp. Silwood2]CAF4304860.1 unnamed protein product [Rotaria sp. Silwood2]